MINAVRRLLVYTHRWLGIVLGALFVCWFASGLVMIYARMPQLTATDRQRGEADLSLRDARIDPSEAARSLDQRPDGLRLTMFDGRPLYRFRVGNHWQAVFADKGEIFLPLDAEAALAEARRFAPDHASTIRHDGRIDAPDQWTLEIARQLPMHRIALGDTDDSRLYISETTGEVLLKTTAGARKWAYPGAILHWFYLTPLRRHGAAWNQFIVWSSLLGTIMCVAGLAWGVWSYSPMARYRRSGRPARSPYSGWMRWHHYAGVIGGISATTWIFSGLLSMDPWDWHPSTSPTPFQREAFSGGGFSIEGLDLQQLKHAVSRLDVVKDAEIVRFRGRRYLASASRLVSLDEGTPSLTTLDRGALLAAAANAGQQSVVQDAAWLDRYDAYYYDRDGELPLPVLRVRYFDPQRTWLYVNPTRGTIARKEERLTRLNRWLYHGLHSLDFPFLYYRRPLWDVVMVLLCSTGLILSLVPIVPAVRRLRRLVSRA